MKNGEDYIHYQFNGDTCMPFGRDCDRYLSLHSGFRELGLVFFYLKKEDQQRKYLESLGIDGDRYLSMEIQDREHVRLSSVRGKDSIGSYAEKLERVGIIKIHHILESFPGRAVITGPRNAIQYLKDMPKIVYRVKEH